MKKNIFILLTLLVVFSVALLKRATEKRRVCITLRRVGSLTSTRIDFRAFPGDTVEIDLPSLFIGLPDVCPGEPIIRHESLSAISFIEIIERDSLAVMRLSLPEDSPRGTVRFFWEVGHEASRCPIE